MFLGETIKDSCLLRHPEKGHVSAVIVKTNKTNKDKYLTSLNLDSTKTCKKSQVVGFSKYRRNFICVQEC